MLWHSHSRSRPTKAYHHRPVDSNALSFEPDNKQFRPLIPPREKLPCKSTVPSSSRSSRHQRAPLHTTRSGAAGHADQRRGRPRRYFAGCRGRQPSRRNGRRPQRIGEPDPQPNRGRHLRHAGQDGSRHGAAARPDGLDCAESDPLRTERISERILGLGACSRRLVRSRDDSAQPVSRLASAQSLVAPPSVRLESISVAAVERNTQSRKRLGRILRREPSLNKPCERLRCSLSAVPDLRPLTSDLFPMSNDFSLGEVQVSLSPKERFEEYLQSRGKRTTQQRRALVDFIFERHDHFDADELIDSLGRRARRREDQPADRLSHARTSWSKPACCGR